MSEFRRIMMSSFLMLLLHFPAADMKYYFHTVRAGDEVTLPSDNVIDDQDKCESTTWTFRDSRSSVRLFEDGQIHKAAKAKSDRLRVTENCSLVIKKVTEEDAGLYYCRQFRPGEQQDPYSLVLLSVVTMTEHQDNDEVTLDCSLPRNGQCRHSVKWLLQGRAVVKDHRDIKTSQSPCSASSSGEATTTGTPPIHEWTSENNNNKETGQDRKHPEGPALWWVLMVSVGLAALIISVVTVHIWTRTKGGKKRIRKNLEQNDEDEDEVNYENDGGPSASV
ncbi:Carcinoembryonic antigen-related cell adhesion molecule 1 [Dissostichus eleginoides]|uniref:Carcinoembryonic antigen-related cell adhesion molecule 1 n=1 Tax=Dissostichus eleginoides TaxID=100907 RepID=A0AAD9F8G2_DISEL|nr:Carcinoembryonic antigen-related cell adhesion molecule 1 [Dissostichus eleginoides]